MAKYLMSSAKELAWKAYLDSIKAIADVINESIIRERFENWWSNNYGNRDTTMFNTEYDVYVNGHRYIRAEKDIQTTIIPAASESLMDCNTCTLAHCRVDCQSLKADGLPHGFKFSASGRVVLDNDVTPNSD
jgi:hypothetical protein